MLHYVQDKYFGDDGYGSDGSWASVNDAFKDIDKASNAEIIQSNHDNLGHSDESDEDFKSEIEDRDDSEDESSENEDYDSNESSCEKSNDDEDDPKMDDSNANDSDEQSCNLSSISRIDASELMLLSDVDSCSSNSKEGTRKLRSKRRSNATEKLHQHVAIKIHSKNSDTNNGSKNMADKKGEYRLGLVTSYDSERGIYCVMYEDEGDDEHQCWINQNELADGEKMWETINKENIDGKNEIKSINIEGVNELNIKKDTRRRPKVDYKRLNDSMFGAIDKIQSTNLDDSLQWSPSESSESSESSD